MDSSSMRYNVFNIVSYSLQKVPPYRRKRRTRTETQYPARYLWFGPKCGFVNKHIINERRLKPVVHRSSAYCHLSKRQSGTGEVFSAYGNILKKITSPANRTAQENRNIF